MRRSFAKIKGVAYIIWHGRHMMYHLLIGLVWAWILRELWDEFSWKIIFFAVFGSFFPDIEHLVYFFVSGRKDEYSKQVKAFLKAHEWRILTSFIETGHKYNTNLSYHNVYFVVFLLALTVVCFLADLESWTTVLGAMVLHYLFDIADDIHTLGYLNENWRRWGSGKKKLTSTPHTGK